MLASIAISMVLVGALPEPPLGADASWTEPNGDATYLAKQVPAEKGCHLQVIHDADQSMLWETDGCFGGKSDKRFLSKDGTRLIVVGTLPAAGGKQAADWRTANVAWLFEKGQLVGSAVAGQFVKDSSMVRREVSHFSWLQGANGVPGVPPRLNDAADGVDLDAIDGTKSQLAFSGFKLKPLQPEKQGKKKHRY